jgi:hypothetical protein
MAPVGATLLILISCIGFSSASVAPSSITVALIVYVPSWT